MTTILLQLILAAILGAGQVGTAHIGDQLIGGRANFAAPSHGSRYLAMRLPRGTWVTICGAGDCVDMTVNDYGPKRSTHDIADIALVKFARVCGFTIRQARRMGECDVEVTIHGRIALPATDCDPKGCG